MIVTKLCFVNEENNKKNIFLFKSKNNRFGEMNCIFIFTYIFITVNYQSVHDSAVPIITKLREDLYTYINNVFTGQIENSYDEEPRLLG